MPSTTWPKRWKKEYQTVIPKKSSPVDPNECRNISCTNLFSKILETFVLNALLSEVQMEDFQYGGIKSTGVNNFLVDMWNEILSGLESNKSAINIMAVDFSKAFNRLKHQACLKALVRRGASNQTVRMIFNFLSGRTMVIRNGFTESKERIVTGGSPQGTKLGNIFLCLTVEGIHETFFTNNMLNVVDVEQDLSPVRNPASQEVYDSPQAAVPMQHRREELHSTPCLNEIINANFKKKRNSMYITRTIA